LGKISTRSFCQTPTQEYVVPRSIPIAGDIIGYVQIISLNNLTS
jgi:hypothetical protein